MKNSAIRPAVIHSETAYEIKIHQFAGTWAEEKKFCESKGGRLPYVNEICAEVDAKPEGGYCDGVGAGGSAATTDKWAAVLDTPPSGKSGEYFGCSSDLMDSKGADQRGCEAHWVHAGDVPGWSNQGKSARWKGWTYCRTLKE
jgi:hypothetical protein